jgi:hypothetical protein
VRTYSAGMVGVCELWERYGKRLLIHFNTGTRRRDIGVGKVGERNYLGNTKSGKLPTYSEFCSR